LHGVDGQLQDARVAVRLASPAAGIVDAATIVTAIGVARAQHAVAARRVAHLPFQAVERVVTRHVGTTAIVDAIGGGQAVSRTQTLHTAIARRIAYRARSRPCSAQWAPGAELRQRRRAGSDQPELFAGAGLGVGRDW